MRDYTYATYESCLEAAGATDVTIYYAGSYQGTWIARCTYQGRVGYVTGSYGSCGGCDELADRDVPKDEQVQIGTGYLEGLLDRDMMRAHLTQYVVFSSEREELLNWLEAN